MLGKMLLEVRVVRWKWPSHAGPDREREVKQGTNMKQRLCQSFSTKLLPTGGKDSDEQKALKCTVVRDVPRSPMFPSQNSSRGHLLLGYLRYSLDSGRHRGALRPSANGKGALHQFPRSLRSYIPFHTSYSSPSLAPWPVWDCKHWLPIPVRRSQRACCGPMSAVAF